MPWLRRNWPYVTLVLAPLLVLWRAVFFGQAIGPFDQIRQMKPWGGPAPAQPWDVLQADGVLQFYPWRELVLESWGRFQVPFWNHYELAGTPLLANSQSAAFYPLHILMGILHVPTATAITLLAWFHLSWAGMGTYFLTKQLGANRLGATLAGMSFTLSAFMTSWTGLPSVITTVAWIPWVLFLIVKVFHEEPTGFSEEDADRVTAQKDLERARSLFNAIADAKYKNQNRTALLLSMSVALMILSGHLQFVAYGVLSAAIVGGWRILQKQPENGPWLRIGTIFGADLAMVSSVVRKPFLARMNFFFSVLFALALASSQLQPVLDYSKHSHRRNAPTEEGYAAYQASAIKPFELIGIMHPNLLGSPSESVANLETPAPLASFWPQYVKRGANFAESAIGLGPLVIGLLLLGRRRFDWRRWGGVALIGLVGLLLATGTILGRLLYFVIPGWSSTGSPGRASVLFVLALCVLAGVLATPGDEPEPKEKWRAYLPVAGVTLIAIISLYALMFALGGLQALPPLSGDALGVIIANGTSQPKVMAALSTLIAAGAIAYWLKEKQRKGWVLLIAAAASFLLSVPQVLRFSESSDLKTAAFDSVELRPYERVANINNPWDLWFAAPANMPPNTSALSRIHELGGYDSLLHRDTVEMLKNVDAGDPATPANGNMMFVKPSATPDKLAEAGVSVVAIRNGDDWQAQRIEGPGRAYTPSGPAEILEESAGHIKLRATGPGKLILKDRNMPGWTALVDGRESPITGEFWREVELSEGQHEVVMNFVAPGYTPFSALAWLLALGFGLSTFKRRPSEVE